MTKNAKIAIIVSILAVIAVIITLSSTVFTVKQAELVWYKEPSANLSSINNDAILQKSTVQSQSVFFLDRDKAAMAIETAYPDVRVISIEVVWPSIMKVHAVERQAVYCLPAKNNKFALVDEYFKVLEVLSTFDNTKMNAAFINSDALKDVEVVKGQDLSIFGKTILDDVYYSFVELERDLIDFKAIIKSITLSESNMTITTHQGTTINIDKPFANTRAKMRLAIKTFDTLTTTDYPNSVIEVFLNLDNELESRFYKN